MIKSKKQMYMVIGIFALVLFLGGVTYAFFNYTRTGVANNIRTGRIYFNTAQSNTLNLTNVFPMSATDAGNANLDAVSLRIWGDTTYADGEEFEISIVDVNNTIGSGQSAKTIPINYIASYSATPVQSGDPNVIGTNSDSYFTARGQSSPVYQLNLTGEATNGEQVLIGYIPSGADGIDGTLTIKAYLDSSKIVISDTYNDGNTPTDNMGTAASFGEGKTVLTTTEWNALQNTQTPLSFKIKAVSQEGTWIEEPADGTIDSCPGCKFTYTSGEYLYTGPNQTSLVDLESDSVILYDDYRLVNKNYFLGFKIENDVVVKAYACGIKGTDIINNVEISPGINSGTPFCLEHSTDGSTFAANNNLILGSTLWNDPNLTNGRCNIPDGATADTWIQCSGSTGADNETGDSSSDNYVNVGGFDGSVHGYCYVDVYGTWCDEW